MNKKCADCSAPLAANQMQCEFCGVVQKDFNEQLLIELMAVKRKYEMAYARANKLIMEPLLADEYVYQLSDGGTLDEPVNKDWFIKNGSVDKNFISFNITNEELTERTGDRATMTCVQTIVRRSFYDESDPYIFRSKLGFVWREGRWQIASEYCVSIDEEGNEIL